MKKLPNGWASTTLGEIVSVRRQKVRPSAMPEMPFLGLEGLEPHTSKVLNYQRAGALKSAAARFSPGDVLYSRLRPYLNKVALAEIEGLSSAEFLVLRPSDAVEGEFVRRRIMAEDFLNFTASLDRGDRPRVNFSQIAKFPVELPPLAEQRRIIAKLNGLLGRTTRAKAELDAIPTLIANYKKVILSSAVSGAMTNTWRKAKGLPNWQKTTVNAVATTVFDGPFGSNLKTSDYVPSGVRVIRLENIGYLKFIEEKRAFVSFRKYQTLKNHALKTDDILFSSFISNNIRVCLFPALPGAAINKSDCFCVRVDPKLCNPRFLAFMLASDQTFKELENSIHGATRPRISLGQLRGYGFKMAPLPEQNEIVNRLEVSFAWIDRIMAEYKSANQLLPNLNQQILKRAFRGELVEQDPSDQSADSLLEKARLIRQQKVTLKDRPSKYTQARKQTKIGRRGKKTMGKKRLDVPPNHLQATLNDLGGRAPAKELWQQSGMDIDEFYKLLRQELKAGHIREGAQKQLLVMAHAA